MTNDLEQELSELVVAPVVSLDLSRNGAALIDLSGDNPLFNSVDLRDGSALARIVETELSRARTRVGLGGYNEDRVWYQRSSLFSSEEEIRTVHLGVDIWCPAGSQIFVPLDGVVHSFQDNNNFGDYGPTIILEHRLRAGPLYSLYGHLSRASLEMLYVGRAFSAGDELAQVGESAENGEWPPHLHFQLMRSLDGKCGDYPGVCSRRLRERYLENCPNPNLIIRSEVLSL